MRLLLQILSVLWGLLLVLIGGRFLLLLFDANRDSTLVQWVMSHSNFWVEPFFGIFHMANKAVASTGGAFEPASLFAFVIYAILGSVAMWAITMPFGGGGFYQRHHPIGV